MLGVKVENIAGYHAPFESVYITDSKGLPFYEMKEAENGEGIYFNLPKGNYFSDRKLIKLKKPIMYKCPSLPKPEKNIPPPVRHEITYTENPNKCSVRKNPNGTMEIFCDHSFLEKPRHFRVFVFMHELGHYHYKTELYCDLFAANEMLKIGYNPSQCYHSSAHTLNTEIRTNELFKFLQKIKPCFKKIKY